MPPLLNVHALPKLVDPEELAGGAAVVVDVLRASTVIIQALACGAREVVPCLEVADARRAAAELPPGQTVLGGERHGVSIRGFDLGNSPEDYTPERVAGKSVILTTTNGTRAMLHARAADSILIGAFVNAGAVVEQLLGREQIHVLCAGTNSRPGDDDLLLAGLLVERLQRLGGMPYLQNQQASDARELWLRSFALPQALGAEPLPPELLAEQLRRAPGGKALVELGFDDDIIDASWIDRFDCVPELDKQDMRIR